MKHIRKFFQTIMVMALAVCLTSMPVMAQEVTDYDVVQQENEAVTYALSSWQKTFTTFCPVTVSSM